MSPWGGKLERPQVGVIAFIVGLTFSALLGAELGNKFDRSSALKAIKMGRQPRVAEHF